MEPGFFRTAALVAAGGLAAWVPALAADVHAGASSASNGGPAQFSETIGVSTPQKRIIGTSHDSGPQGPAASDERLLNQVVRTLVKDPAMQGADIRVSVQSGQVTLEGRTKDSSQADQAKQAAENIAGSGKVTSKLSASG